MPTPIKLPWKQRLWHEFIDYWLTVLYLAVYFGAFTVYRRLILAGYEIEYLNYGFALIQALILAKVILVGDLFLTKPFKNKPLAIPTLFRTVTFTIWVVIFSILEHTVRGLLRNEGLAGGANELLGKGKYELLANCLVVFFTFIPFFALRESNRVLGEGKIWNLFFHSRSDDELAQPSG